MGMELELSHGKKNNQTNKQKKNTPHKKKPQQTKKTPIYIHKWSSPGISTWKSSFLPVLQKNFLSLFIFLQQDYPIPRFLSVFFYFFPRNKVLDDVRRLIQPGDVIGRTVFDLDEPRWVT